MNFWFRISMLLLRYIVLQNIYEKVGIEMTKIAKTGWPLDYKCTIDFNPTAIQRKIIIS
jgi:hypothetical protein